MAQEVTEVKRSIACCRGTHIQAEGQNTDGEGPPKTNQSWPEHLGLGRENTQESGGLPDKL